MTLAGPRLTAIGSGKGGTGKTFVALTLAQAFADLGERVLLCDADLGLSNTSVHLGLSHCGDLPGFLAGRTPLKAALAAVTTEGHQPFDLLAAPPGSGALASADKAAIDKLSHLLRHVAFYDRVLIDLGAGIGEAVLTLAADADDVVVVMTPDPAALTDAYAFVKLVLKRTGGRAPGLLVNMAANAPEAKRTAEALTNSARNFLKVAPPYLGFIPTDMRVVECLRRQSSLWQSYPHCPALTAITGLTSLLGGGPARIRANGSLR
ncbi:MAG: P-loop NTPase [Rhizomicrobium sp.]|nr:P-loop NTPase [Rhizomicrobium sp.]